MDIAEDRNPLTLDAQYTFQGNIVVIRMRFLDLARYQYAFMCRVKPYPDRMIQEDEFNHLLLIDHMWGACGEMEFIDLKGIQTGVRFFRPGPVKLSEIEKYENAVRRNYSRPRIGLWLWENLGFTTIVIELFAEELYRHRVTSLQLIESLAAEKLGLSTSPLYPFQMPPAPQIGTSHTPSDISQPQAGMFPPPRDIPQLPVGISQIQPIDPKPPFGISQMQPDIDPAQAEVDWDIPREQAMGESNTPLNRDDHELLRLWNDGLAVKAIGLRIGKADKTVANRLSFLRGMLGTECVPLRKAPTRKNLG